MIDARQLASAEDNGEGGNGPPDLASDVQAAYPGRAAVYCARGRPLPTYPEQHGNIQVHE